MPSGVAIREAGHCIVAFNLGFRIEKVSISDEKGLTTVLVNQIKLSEKLNEILEKARLIEKKEMEEKARLDEMLENARSEEMFAGTLADRILKSSKREMLEHEYASLDKMLESERATILEEIDVERKHEELVEKSEDLMIDVLLAGYAAELKLWKPPKEYFKRKYSIDRQIAHDMAVFLNPGPRKRDSWSKLSDMRERAKEDLRRCDEIINMRKKRIASLEKASTSVHAHYIPERTRMLLDHSLHDSFIKLLLP